MPDEIESTPLLGNSDPSHSKTDKRSGTGLRSVGISLALGATLLLMLADAAHSVSDIELARYLFCSDKHTETGEQPSLSMLKLDPRCYESDVSQRVAFLMGFTPMAEAIPCTIMVLVYGRLSDTWGRRPIFFVVAIGSLGQLLAKVSSANFYSLVGVLPIYLGAVFSGLCGSGAALKSALWCYLCETLSEEERITAFSWVAGLSYGSVVVGPSFGSWLLQFGLTAPLWFGTLLSSLALVVICFLPESLVSSETEDQTAVSYSDLARESLSGVKLLFSQRTALVLGFVTFCWDFTTGAMLVFVQHLINFFGWSTTAGANFYSAFALAKVATFLLAMPAVSWLLADKIHRFNFQMFRFGILGYGVAFFCYAMIRDLRFLPLIVALQAISSPFTIVMRSYIADLAPADEIGRVFAAMSLVESLGDVLGPAAWNGIYAALLGKSREASSSVFLVVAATYVVAHCSTYFMSREIQRGAQHDG